MTKMHLADNLPIVLVDDSDQLNEAVKILKVLISVLCGALVGVVLHYYLYRIGLPLQPFIYQAF